MGVSQIKWPNHYPCTNVYGMARSLLAVATMATLSFNRLDVLFTPAVGAYTPPCSDAGFWSRISIFCRRPPKIILILLCAGFRSGLTTICEVAGVRESQPPFTGGSRIVCGCRQPFMTEVTK